MTVSPKQGENFNVLSRHHCSHFTSPHFSSETGPITTIASKAGTIISHLFIKGRVAANSDVWQKQLMSPSSHSFFLNKKNARF